MSVNVKNTEAAAEKVVRSHLSQQFENAKSGIYPEGIEETKLEEPTLLIRKPHVNPELSPGPDNSSDIRQLMTLSLSKENIRDLKKLIDARRLEDKLDAWAGLKLHDFCIIQNPELAEERSKRSDYITRLEDVCKTRHVFIDAVHDYVSKITRWHLLNKEFGFRNAPAISMADVLAVDFPTRFSNSSFWKFYDPLYLLTHRPNEREARERFTNLERNARGFGNPGKVLDYTDTLASIAEIFQSDALKVLNMNVYNSIHIVRMLHWAAVTMDNGYTPQFAVAPQQPNTEDMTIHSIGTSATTIPIRSNFPSLMDVGFHKEIHNRVALPITSIYNVAQAVNQQIQAGALLTPNNLVGFNGNIFGGSDIQVVSPVVNESIQDFIDSNSGGNSSASPLMTQLMAAMTGFPHLLGQTAATWPTPVRNPIPVPNHDLSYPNLAQGNLKNPALKIRSIAGRMKETTEVPEERGPHPFGTAFRELSVAHLCSMLRSEALQSLGYSGRLDRENRRSNTPDVVSSEWLPRVSTREQRTIGEPLLGIGSTVLGVPSDNSLSSAFTSDAVGNNPKNSKAEAAIRIRTPESNFEDLSNINTLIYEKVLSSQSDLSSEHHGGYIQDEKIHNDLYTTLLKKILDPDVSEAEREVAIRNIRKVSEDSSSKLHEAVRFVADMSGMVGGPESLQDTWTTSTNLCDTKRIFSRGYIRPIVQVIDAFINNDFNDYHPYTYWADFNQSGINGDKTLIAQIAAMILSSNNHPDSGAASDLDSPGAKLRAQIVKAVIARDLKRIDEQATPVNVPRIIGYHPKVIERQQAVNMAMGPYAHNFEDNRKIVLDSLVGLGFLSNSLPHHFFTQHGHTEARRLSIDEAQQIAITWGAEDHISHHIHHWGTRRGSSQQQQAQTEAQQIELDRTTNIKDQAAVRWLRQGGLHSSYRVTKFNRLHRMIDSINGYKSHFEDDRLDLYDIILIFVDELDRGFSAIENTRPGNNRVQLRDNSFNEEVQARLFGKVGYFSPDAGLTRANSFDRSLLISIAVDIISDSLEHVFQVSAGMTSANVITPENLSTRTSSTVAFERTLASSAVCEVLIKSMSHFHDLDRDRMMDGHISHPTVDPNTGEQRNLKIINYSGMQRKPYTMHKLKLIYQGIMRGIQGISEGFGNVEPHTEDVKNSQRLACYLMRCSSLPNDATTWRKINNVVDPAGQFLHGDPWYYNKEIRYKIDPNGAESVHRISPHTINIDRPYGNLPLPKVNVSNPLSDEVSIREVTFWWHVYGANANTMVMGSPATRRPLTRFYSDIANTLQWLSRQEGAALRSSLVSYELGLKHAKLADDLNKAYDAFTASLAEIRESHQSSRSIGNYLLPYPKEVSKSQMAYRRELLFRMKDSIRADLNTTRGFKSDRPDVRDLTHYGAHLFLDDLLVRMDSEESDEKRFILYGIGPNIFYEKLLEDAEKLVRGRSNMIPLSGEMELFSNIKMDLMAVKQNAYEDEIVFKPAKIGTVDCNCILLSNEVNGILGLTRSDGNFDYTEILHRVQWLKTMSSRKTDYDSVWYFHPSSVGLSAVQNRIDVENKKSKTSLARIFSGNNAGDDLAKRIIERDLRKKLDAYYLKYILERVTGLSLREEDVGTFRSEKYLDKGTVDRYFEQLDNILNPLSENDTNFKGITFADVKDLLEETSIEVQTIGESGRPSNTSINVYRFKRYNDELKRDLKPTLQRKEDEPEATLIPPKLSGKELLVLDMISRSSIFQNLAALSPALFDQIALFELPKNTSEIFEIDKDATPPEFLDEAGNLKPDYAEFLNNVSIETIHPYAKFKIGSIWNV